MQYWVFGWIRWYLSFFAINCLFICQGLIKHGNGKSPIYRLTQGFPASHVWWPVAKIKQDLRLTTAWVQWMIGWYELNWYDPIIGSHCWNFMIFFGFGPFQHTHSTYSIMCSNIYIYTHTHRVCIYIYICVCMYVYTLYIYMWHVCSVCVICVCLFHFCGSRWIDVFFHSDTDP